MSARKDIKKVRCLWNAEDEWSKSLLLYLVWEVHVDVDVVLSQLSLSFLHRLALKCRLSKRTMNTMNAYVSRYAGSQTMKDT